MRKAAGWPSNQVEGEWRAWRPASVCILCRSPFSFFLSVTPCTWLCTYTLSHSLLFLLVFLFPFIVHFFFLRQGYRRCFTFEWSYITSSKERERERPVAIFNRTIFTFNRECLVFFSFTFVLVIFGCYFDTSTNFLAKNYLHIILFSGIYPTFLRKYILVFQVYEITKNFVENFLIDYIRCKCYLRW